MFEQLWVIKVFAALGWAFVLLWLLPISRAWLDTALRMPTPTTRHSLSAIDALRGLAALWVALFHYWQWTSPYFDEAVGSFPILIKGEKAVPVFVVLSGFLIWRTARQIKDRNDLTRYAQNRALRLFPLYIAVILVIFAVGFAAPVLPLWRNLMSELLMARAFGSRVSQLPPAWSLYLELIFYLAAPCLAAIFGKRAVWLSACAALAFTVPEYVGMPREFLLWKFFFLGILAAEIHERYGVHIGPALAALLTIVGLGLFILDVAYDFDLAAMWESNGTLVRTGDRDATYVHTFTVGASFALMLLGILQTPAISKALAVRPLRILGVISYSVFMWHAVLIWADFPVRPNGGGNLAKIGLMPWPYGSIWDLLLVVIPGLLGAGVLSFLCIERPFLRLRPARASQPDSPEPDGR